MSIALSVRDLSLRYGRRLVLSGVSFELRAGQCLAVLGANGSGKTTLLRSIVGCLSPGAGEIRLDGLLPRDALSRVAVAYFAGVPLDLFLRIEIRPASISSVRFYDDSLLILGVNDTGDLYA